MMYRIIKAGLLLQACGQLAAGAAAGSGHGRGGRAGSLAELFQPLQPPSLILFLKYKIILPLISLVVRAQHRPISHRGDLVQQVLVVQSFILG